MTERCAELLKEAPDLTMQIVVADNDLMAPALRNGELDVIFNVIPSVAYAGCVQEHLFDDEFVVCASASHPLAKRRRLSMADLVHERCTLSAPTY